MLTYVQRATRTLTSSDLPCRYVRLRVARDDNCDEEAEYEDTGKFQSAQEEDARHAIVVDDEPRCCLSEISWCDHSAMWGHIRTHNVPIKGFVESGFSGVLLDADCFAGVGFEEARLASACSDVSSSALRPILGDGQLVAFLIGPGETPIRLKPVRD